MYFVEIRKTFRRFSVSNCFRFKQCRPSYFIYKQNLTVHTFVFCTKLQCQFPHTSVPSIRSVQVYISMSKRLYRSVSSQYSASLVSNYLNSIPYVMLLLMIDTLTGNLKREIYVQITITQVRLRFVRLLLVYYVRYGWISSEDTCQWKVFKTSCTIEGYIL